MKSKTTSKRTVRGHTANRAQVKNISLLLPIIQRMVRTYLARQCHYSANDSIGHLNSYIKLYDAQFLDSMMAEHFIPNTKTKLHIIYTYNDSYLRSLVIKRDDSLYKYFARRAL